MRLKPQTILKHSHCEICTAGKIVKDTMCPKQVIDLSLILLQCACEVGKLSIPINTQYSDQILRGKWFIDILNLFAPIAEKLLVHFTHNVGSEWFRKDEVRKSVLQITDSCACVNDDQLIHTHSQRS